MNNFFTPADPLDKIIADTLSDKQVLDSKHILTGWTNIVIEVTTDKGSYFFRFPTDGEKAEQVFCQNKRTN